MRAYGFPSIIMGLKSPSLKSGHHDLFFLRCMRAPYWRVVTRGCCCCIKEISDLSFEKWDCCLGGSSSSIGVGLLPWGRLSSSNKELCKCHKEDIVPIPWSGAIAMERPSSFLREWGYCHGETNSINWKVVHRGTWET